MKNIVITGSSRGLGLAMAKVFLSSGCSVTISGRGKKNFDNPTEAHLGENPGNAKTTLVQHADRVLFVPCDVQKKKDLEALWNISQKQWGRIDHWINNAGQNAPYKHIHDTATDNVDDIIDTNIKGMIYGSQIAARNMLEQGGGQIWNMEGLGSNGMMQEKTILYGMTKRALTYFTKGLARELGSSGVLAGRLSPGMMLTDFITKAPDGEVSALDTNPQFKTIFNILADRPETVAAYLVPKMLANTHQNAHIVWMNGGKATLRFITAPFTKRKLI